MAVRRLAEVQPDSFAFTADNVRWAEREIAKYPAGRQHSAVIALLGRAQQQHGGWLPEPAIRHVAGILDMPYIRALEIATFYTMFQLEPVGRIAHIAVCGTTPCMLRGAEDLKDICRHRIAHHPFEVSADGNFSWEEVECAGACVNAPMIQIGADTFEDLTPESFDALLDDLAAGRPVRHGPQIDRIMSAPEGGPTTLHDHHGPTRAARRPGAAAPAASPLTDAEAKEPTDAANLREKPSEAAEPMRLREPRNSAPDDLRRIAGIGARMVELLHGIGIYHFDQIAEWTPGNAAWIDHELSLRGRIKREDWVGKAKALAAGSGGKG
ncbi:MAG: NADH-quinone oxidoreductase subunit NuoE [Bauldia sp.]|nr:NADH-quinone oxidoreductase subunit NuoE [Bauldia sp.]